MFNLLIHYGGWSGSRGLLSKARVFEYTADDISTRFAPKGKLETDLLSRLPTIFASEIGGDGSQEARVGRITQVREVGTNYQIDFLYDPAIAPISNRKLAELADDLDFGDYEFSRTHWAIKDVDLFYVLMRNSTVTPTPRVFSITTGAVKPNLLSVMMPFDARFQAVYDELELMARGLGMQCTRADNMWDNEAIIQDIVSLISTSNIVICDLSGRNANVFYETGIAHTLGRHVILITQSHDDVPFDLRHLRYVHYLDNHEGREKLGQQVRSRIQTLRGTSSE